MGGKNKKVTVGYEYYAGMHIALCHGPVDAIVRVRVDKKDAWTGIHTGGALSIDAPDLFGGKSREGGVQGTLDFEQGGPAQGQNDYLAGILGNVPAFRGVTAAVLRQMYLGLNPYLKPWSFRLQRIHTRKEGVAQWYDTKAAIPTPVDIAILPLANQAQVVKWINRNVGIFYIGAGNEPSGTYTDYNLPLVGRIAGVRISRVARYTGRTMTVPTAPLGTDADTVVNLPLTANILDACGHTVTPSGSPSVDAIDGPPGFGGSLAVNGSQWLAVAVGSGDEDLGDNWTIEAWLKWAGNSFQHWFGYGAISTPAHDTVCFVDPRYTGFSVQETAPEPTNPQVDEVVLSACQECPQDRWFYFAITCQKADATYNYYLHVDGKIANFSACSGSDMNPAHIVRECLTDPDWGMGYPETDIDDDTFMAAADMLYSEQMGISLLWDKQLALEDFVSDIVRHIDAALYVDRTTGKFRLKLIRDDYDPDSLLVLDESNIVRIENCGRPSIAELTNSVTINYWDSAQSTDASLTVQDIALVQMQGAVVGTTIQYPGFTHGIIASRVAQRDLRALSTPLLTCTVTANRAAAVLDIGDVFRLQWPDLGVTDTIMRVTHVAFGDGRSNRVQVQAVQDIFGLPQAIYAPATPTEWISPVSAPVAAAYRLAFESPYYELVQRFGQTDVDSTLVARPEAGYVEAAAVRPAADALYAQIASDAGAGYSITGSLDFCSSAVLTADMGPGDTTAMIGSGVDLDVVTLGTHAQIGDELVRVDTLSDLSLTLGRGILDTVPAAHASGTRIYFWDEYARAVEIEYADGETISLKVLPVTGSGALALADAPVDSITLASRAIRPYPPGKLRIDGEAYPAQIIGDLVVNWAHRDRIQQTAALIDTETGDIGPEAGTTYVLRVYDGDEVLQHEATGITGTSYTWGGATTPVLCVVLGAERDGIESWQAHSHCFNVIYARLTESGDVRITEAGDIRILE